MALSIDPSHLEIVGRYATFIELLSQPEKVKAIIEDIRQTTEENKKILGLTQTKETIDAFRVNTEKELEKQFDELDQAKKDFQEQVSKEQKRLQDIREELNHLASTFNEKKLVAEQASVDALKAREEAEKLLFDNKRQAQILADKRESLEKALADIQERQAQLQKLLG